TYNFVILDYVVRIYGGGPTDAEIIQLSRVPISTDPVRTEPVMACARQSYTAAGSPQVPVGDGNVGLDQVRIAADQDARIAVRSRSHTRDRVIRACVNNDAVRPEALDHTRSLDLDSGLVQDANALLRPGGVDARATGLPISQAG